MSDDPKADSDWPPVGDAVRNTAPNGWRSLPAAVYGLEHPLLCPACRAEIDQLFVVRLFRARVNFMSSLPRSGRVLVCPKCRTIVPGELGAVI